MMKKLIAGNWKMNTQADTAAQLTMDILKGLESDLPLARAVDFAIFPPYVHLPPVNAIIKGVENKVVLGAQDCSAHSGEGAYTGQICASMLAGYGCSLVILGHSERRHGLGESSKTIASKAQSAHDAGLITIVCVGETQEERESGKENDVVRSQLEGSLPASANAVNTIIAYEPVWAIGTGRTATTEDVAAMHAMIRQWLAGRIERSESVRILYGGSMKPANAEELLKTPNVDGGLIGGASLKAEEFLAIGKALLEGGTS
ncbi:MAG: triose-phosphate isomerase [Alphaproteobacteria bacterium]|nr:triose-phosphate isomerase [Alphaproteobacteria bacterium]